MTITVETGPARSKRSEGQEESRPEECCGRCHADEEMPEEARCERCRISAPPVGGLALPGLGRPVRAGDDHRPEGITPPLLPR